ncbi:MAG: beta strand repeat-containing protein [Cyanobacteriota bacterium]
MAFTLFAALLQDWRLLLTEWSLNGILSRAAQDALRLPGEPVALQQLVSRWSGGDFKGLPPVVVLGGTAMPSAAGAYAITTNTIYLNADWLRNARAEQVLDVLNEELGHYLDGLLNSSDTPGDEGELFAALLKGNDVVSEGQRREISAQDDHSSEWVAGQELAVEHAAVVGTIIDDEKGSISGIKWNDINGNGVREDLIQGSKPDIAFVIDASGSTTSSFVGGSVGDVNGDGSINTILDAQLAAYIALNNRLVTKGFGSTARVGIVSFDSVATQQDMNPILTGFQTTTSPAADLNGNSKRDVDDRLITLRSGGSTNFEAALQSALALLQNAGSAAGSGNIIFLSDGFPDSSTNFTDEVSAILAAGYKLSAFGVGTGSSLTDLNKIDPNATIFTSTDQLLAVFDSLGSGGSSFKEPGLAGVNVYLDLNNNGIFDAGEPTQLTRADNPLTANVDETGQYTFANLAPGTYTVREVVPSGFTQTFPNAPGSHTVVIGSGQNVINKNFGNTQPATVTLSVSPSQVLEDGTTNLIYTFTRTGNLSNVLTVNYTVGGSATLARDYTGIAVTPATKTVTFAAGLATATLTIDPTADNTVESDESVTLTLAAGTGYTVGTTTPVTGTITNDDSTVTLAVAPATVAEDGTTNLIYTFTRTGFTSNALTVNYAIAGTADASDYTGATPGTAKIITFAAGSATATLTIDPTADNAIETNETVSLTLAAGSGYSVGTTTAVVGTINNDDFPVITLAVSPAVVAEDGITNLIYTFSRTGLTTAALTVNYTVGGTATLATDYTGIAATPATKTVSFAAGAATATLTINPVADTTIEPDETVALTLTAGSGYIIGTPTAVVGTIIDDDVSSLTAYIMRPAESSLLLLGTKRINAVGNDLNNTITGNSNNNRLAGLLGADVLTGGGSADSDLFVYNSFNESLLGTGSSFDVITDFNSNDRIVAPFSVESDRLSSSFGNLSSLAAAPISGLLNATTFSSNSVAAFTVTGQVGTFVAMNDSRAGFQADSDAVVFLKNYSLSVTSFAEFA